MADTKTIPCPHCGESINKNAKACPFCGSDEQTGWSENTYLDDIGLDDEFDYDELAAKEFPGVSSSKKKITWIAVAGAIVLFFFIAAMLKMLW